MTDDEQGNDAAAAVTSCREILRMSVERQAIFTKSEQFEGLTLPQLTEKKKMLENMFNRFLDEHLVYVQKCDRVEAEPPFKSSDQYLEEVELVYVEAISMYQNKIETLIKYEKERTGIDNRVNASASGGQQLITATQELTLERIPLPKFNGDFVKWNEWRAMFDSLVHNKAKLTTTEKFHYLKSSVTDDANRVLSGWHMIGENYMAAYDELVKLYENKYRIVLAHLTELTNMQVQRTETYQGLREMIDTINRSLRQLKAIGSPVEYWDHMIIHHILSRIAPRTTTAWETSHDLTEMPSLEMTLKFLERRARSIVNVGQSSGRAGNLNGAGITASTSQASPHGGAVARQSNSAAMTQQSTLGFQTRTPHLTANVSQALATPDRPRGISCFLCRQPHPVYRCKSLLDLSIEDRRAKIIELQLCANCFSPNHILGSDQCRYGQCRRCNNGEYHNSVLCSAGYQSPQTTEQSVATVHQQLNEPIENQQKN